MSDTAKRLVGVRRVSLAGMGEEWGNECYALYLPATFEDKKTILEYNEAGSADKIEQLAFQKQFVIDHYVKGYGKVFNGVTFEVSELTAEEAISSTFVADAIFAAIMGVDIDPKAGAAAATEKTALTASETPTETI